MCLVNMTNPFLNLRSVQKSSKSEIITLNDPLVLSSLRVLLFMTENLTGDRYHYLLAFTIEGSNDQRQSYTNTVKMLMWSLC